jgi:hypothetical protein
MQRSRAGHDSRGLMKTDHGVCPASGAAAGGTGCGGRGSQSRLGHPAPEGCCLGTGAPARVSFFGVCLVGHSWMSVHARLGAGCRAFWGASWHALTHHEAGQSGSVTAKIDNVPLLACGLAGAGAGGCMRTAPLCKDGLLLAACDLVGVQYLLYKSVSVCATPGCEGMVMALGRKHGLLSGLAAHFIELLPTLGPHPEVR